MGRKLLVLAIGVSLGASIVPRAASAAGRGTSVDWPKIHFDLANDGYNPFETVLSPAVVSNGLRKEWARGLSATGDNASVAVVGNVLYAPFGDEVYAADAATGRLRWKSTVGLTCSAPTVADGSVFIGTGDGQVVALDATTGSELWSTDVGGLLCSSPAVHDGVVFVGWTSTDLVTGGLVALDSTSGTTLWTAPFSGGVYDTTPAVGGGTVYISAIGGTLHALDELTGTEIWHFDTGANEPSSPVISGGLVYVQAGQTIAVGASTGTEVWSFPAGGYSAPAIANGVLFVASADGNVYAVDAVTGDGLWTFEGTGDLYEYFDASPAVADGVVYVGSEYQFCCRPSEGRAEASQGSPDSFFPAHLYAIDASTGDQLWQYGVGYDLYTFSPVVVNGRLYAGTNEGIVAMFDPK